MLSRPDACFLARRRSALPLVLALLPLVGCAAPDRGEDPLGGRASRAEAPPLPLPVRIRHLMQEEVLLPEGLVWAEWTSPTRRKAYFSGAMGGGGRFEQDATPSNLLHRANGYATVSGLQVAPEVVDLDGNSPRPAMDFAGTVCDALAAPYLELGLKKKGGHNLGTFDSVLRSTRLEANGGLLRMEISVYLNRKTRDAILVTRMEYADPPDGARAG